MSPTVYLHWHGDAVPAWLDQLKDRMNGRFSDASYAAARFVGICHANIDGNLSLGISSNDLSQADVRSKDRMESESPGNAGIVVVDTSDFTWKAYGGHLADIDREAAMTRPTRQRADRCEQTITAYSDDDDFTSLVDFLADAMHYCDCTGQDFHIALAQACRHYIHELNDQQHDERRMIP